MRSTTRILLFLFFVSATLLWFNLSGRPLESELQSQFNEWSVTAMKELATGNRVEGLTAEGMVTSGAAMRAKWVLPVLTLDNKEANEQLIRIIELARESNIFSANQNVSDDMPSAKITIADPKHSFTATVPNSYLNKNIKASNLFKLFELFSNQQPGEISTSKL